MSKEGEDEARRENSVIVYIYIYIHIFPFSLRISMQQTNKAGRVGIKILSSFEAEKFFTNVKIDPGEIRSRTLVFANGKLSARVFTEYKLCEINGARNLGILPLPVKRSRFLEARVNSLKFAQRKVCMPCEIIYFMRFDNLLFSED